MCLLAVLGIALAGYLAVSNQSMKFSNRSFQKDLSTQLAEMGLEEALRAFNSNNWATWTNAGTTATWTLSGTTATCNLAFPATKFGQGVTGSIKIRVDNYNAGQLDAPWSSSANYSVNDLVGYNGTWYRCVQNNTNQAPNGWADLTYWVATPIPWTWSSNITYAPYSAVNYIGVWYRCTATSTNNVPPNATYWATIPTLSLVWNSATTYNAGSFVFSGGTWYRCVTTNTNSFPPNANWTTAAPYISFAYQAATPYAFNDYVYNGTWYRCIAATSTGSAPPSANWEYARSGSMFGWNSASINYNLGDVVYYSTTGLWYRCILAHTSSGSIPPSNATYWSNAPLYSTAWDSGKQYSQNDAVRYNGVWYLSLLNSNTVQNPSTATTYWIGANTGTASYQWDAATAYSAGNYRCYGGVWYKCLISNTGYTPNNTTYWTASWANSFGITTGARVVYAEGSAVLLDGSAPIKTQLRATVTPAPLFPNAIAATADLNISGAGTVDSYDSTLGTYASPTAGYSAVLAGGSTSGTAVTVTSTTVQGYVAAPSSSTSPYAPLASFGGSAVVKGSAATPSPKVDLTRLSRSPYVPQFDCLPSGGLTTAFSSVNFPRGTLLAPAATTNIGTPGATTPSRYYYNGSLTLSGSTYNIININGPVILYINGDLTMDSGTPNGKININSTGSAEIHIAGSLNVNIGSDGFNNTTLDPKKLIIICDTASSSTQNYSDGTSAVYGVIYMPNTTSASGLSLDTSTAIQIYGAISAKKITYSVDANLHYDTSLRYATLGGMDNPYIISQWRELTDPAEKANLP